MKIYETKKVAKQVLVKTECDRCRNPIITSTFDLFKAELVIKEGDGFPEGSFGTVKDMQLCQDCAVKLEELLAENGYRINSSEIE